MTSPESRLRVGVVLFEGFELLDVFGPAEVYGVLPKRFELRLIGPHAGSVTSAQGPAVIADCGYTEAPAPGVVLVPGGIGTRRLVEDRSFLAWLADWAAPAPLVTSVCTGSAVLARTGLLDDRRATSNKRAVDWVVSQGPGVDWVASARWVADSDRWTSSGVAAGMDTALAIGEPPTRPVLRRRQRPGPSAFGQGGGGQPERWLRGLRGIAGLELVH